jgi:linoleate 10R-lipoxygenase
LYVQDPRLETPNIPGHEGTPRGIGNQVSCEFNLAYRWHSCISENDEKWTEEIYKELFGKKADEVSFPELLTGLSKWEKNLPADPMKRPFAHLQRGQDGKFPDDDLVRIMQTAIEDVAGEITSRPEEPL